MTPSPTRAGKAQEARTDTVTHLTVLRVPRALLSPNKWQGRHWRFKHRDSQSWEQEIWAQQAIHRGTSAALASRVRGYLGATSPVRTRVTITRIVPSKRNFIRDDDNLRFATKPLNDALKRLRLIHSDAREWLEQPMPTQEVSPTGEWATVIQIETLA